MKEKNCCLEMKVEIEKDNPLIDIKKILFKDTNVEVIPYLPRLGDKGYLVELMSDYKEEFVNSITEFVEGRQDIQIIPNSYRFADDKDIIDCWTKSPSLDLITSCVLKEYNLLHNKPSEYFYLFGDKRILLRNILKPAFNKVNGDLDKIDWTFHDKFQKIRYNSLSLLEGYKLGVALEKDFFQLRDPKLLTDLAEELSTMTGKQNSNKMLANEINGIGIKLCEYVDKGNYKKPEVKQRKRN